MTAINVNLPESLLKKASELAAADGISIDHFISLALAEKMSVWLTEDVIEQRARRGNREKFAAALDQVPDVPPDENDRL